MLQYDKVGEKWQLPIRIFTVQISYIESNQINPFTFIWEHLRYFFHLGTNVKKLNEHKIKARKINKV